MGLFNRSNGAASPGRPSQLIKGLCEGKADNDSNAPKIQSLAGENTANDKTCMSALLSQPAATPLPKANPTGTGPWIPVRTSSKEALATGSLVRSLSRKGRRLKSSASKLSLVSNISISSILSASSKDADLSKDTIQDTSKPEKRNVSTASISSPVHFRHLTHALPQQFPKISSSSQSDLVAEFSAIRASQNTRRDFRGIRAMDLHSRTSSMDTSTTPITASEASFSPSPVSLSTASNSSHSSLPTTNRSSLVSDHDIWNKRSTESFSQPFSSSRSPRVSMATPQSPPPRRSSRRASTHYEDVPCVRISQINASSESRFSSSYRTRVDQELSHGTLGILDGLADKPPENQRSHLSEDQHPRLSEWPLCSYGRPLPCVTEEDMGIAADRSTNIIGLYGLHQHSSYHAASVSPDPNSQASTATIIPSLITPLHNQGLGPAKSSLPEIGMIQRRPLQRSSLNNGLFTSWSFEDEAHTSRKNNQDLMPEKQWDLQAHVKPIQACIASGSPCSRIPIRPDTSLQVAW